MRRWFERLYPLITSICILIGYIFFLEDCHASSLSSNSNNIITITITLASIFLGFIGVMLGAIISIRFTSMMDVLVQRNAILDLISYVKHSFASECISLAIAIGTLLINTPNAPLPKWEIYLLIFCISYMILSTIRIILILFALTNVPDDTYHGNKNLAGKKPYVPKNL